MNIKVVVLSLEDVDRTEGRNDFDLYKKTENTKHGSDRRYKMARIADFRCTYDNASGFGAWAAEDYGIKFPDAYTEHEMMVKLALAVKKHNGAAVCLLPFCHTLEAEALGEIIRLGDGVTGPVSSTSLISLEQYKTFSLPYFQKNVDFIKSQGGGCGLHICGTSRKLWECLNETGIGTFGLDNVEELTEAKEVLGGHMCIQGNVPPVEVMRLGTPQDVLRSARECIKKGHDSRCGFVLTSGCQMPMHTPKENMLALMDAARIFGRYPLNKELWKDDSEAKKTVKIHC